MWIINITKKAHYFCHGILYPIGGLCCTLLLLFWQWWKDSLLLSTFMGWRGANWECYKAFTQTLANLCFSGIRLEFDSAFPQKLDWNNWSIISRPRFLPESSGNFTFSDLFLRATMYRKDIHTYERFFFFAIISGPQFVEIHLILLPWQCDIMTSLYPQINLLCTSVHGDWEKHSVRYTTVRHRPANSPNSAESLAIFYIFLTASQEDSQSHDLVFVNRDKLKNCSQVNKI